MPYAKKFDSQANVYYSRNSELHKAYDLYTLNYLKSLESPAADMAGGQPAVKNGYLYIYNPPMGWIEKRHTTGQYLTTHSYFGAGKYYFDMNQDASKLCLGEETPIDNWDIQIYTIGGVAVNNYNISRLRDLHYYQNRLYIVNEINTSPATWTVHYSDDDLTTVTPLFNFVLPIAVGFGSSIAIYVLDPTNDIRIATPNGVYKLNSSGTVLKKWEKASSYTENAKDLHIDSDGNMIILGQKGDVLSIYLFDKDANANNEYVMKNSVDVGVRLLIQDALTIAIAEENPDDIEWEVINVKSWGDDSTGDGSPTKPFATLYNAVHVNRYKKYIRIYMDGVTESPGTLEIGQLRGLHVILSPNTKLYLQNMWTMMTSEQLVKFEGGAINLR